MGAALGFFLLKFSLLFWVFPIHRSAGYVANDIIPPAVSPTSSVNYPHGTGFAMPGGLNGPSIGEPAPYESRFRHPAGLQHDLGGSHPERSYHKHHHHHHHHHHHRENNQSPPPGHRGANLGYALSPASSPVYSQMPIHTHSRPSSSSPPYSTLVLPPRRNQDCTTLTCTEPLTYSPSGFTCGCVWPIQVKMRFSVALYTFFPLISELAKEIASSLALNQSQVRITGANAASQQLEKTFVLVNLVPLETKFNYSAALLTYEKFWHRKILINSSIFGVYDVLDVHYPGLPPSPPSIASNLAAIDDHSYSSDHGNNDGSLLKPLGVNVPRRQKNWYDGRQLAAIVISSITALVICASIMWVLTVRHKRSAQLEELTPTPMSSFTKPSGAARSLSGSLSFASGMLAFTGSAKIYTLDDVNKATNGFDSSRVLGEGGFGVVYQGTLGNGEEVAVKVLKRDNRHGGREFLSEVEMLSRLHHRNLVKLIGICTEDNVRCLVYELVPNGSVESHLHGVCKEIAPLDWKTRMKIALGSARGLAYLHEDSSPCVIHRDFKASNILLEYDFTPKVSDFGLARSGGLNDGNQPISTHVIGTFGYVAPEYAMTGHILVKSDVYSYGVVLLELLTGRKPVDFSKPPGQENLVAWAHPFLTTNEGLETIMDPTLSLTTTTPFESFSKVAAIASMCVQPEVSRRPFMGEVVQALKLICSELEDSKPEAPETQVEEELKTCKISAEFDEFSLVKYSEPKIAFSANDLVGELKEKEFDECFRRQCSSSGPLRLGVKKKFWKTFGLRVSRGSMKERLWSGSH